MAMFDARPNRLDYFLSLACLVATRSTCPRRRVGCVLVDENNHVLATGYNGVPRGVTHCTDQLCPGAGFKSGEGYEFCQATHAEQNALLQCPDVMKVQKVYCTTQPCFTCTKLLMNTGAEEIHFLDEHADLKGFELWCTHRSKSSWSPYRGKKDRFRAIGEGIIQPL